MSQQDYLPHGSSETARTRSEAERPGELLRRRRKEERYSLRTLSKAMGGISGKDRIARIERGRLPPGQVRIDETRAFYEILGIPAQIWTDA